MTTDRDRFNAGYPINGIDARQGNIIARKSTRRTYGYELYNTRVNQRFMWFKLKRVALEKIIEIKRY